MKKKGDNMKLKNNDMKLDMLKRENKIYELCEKLFPICRSITGQGVRDTLNILKEHIPLNMYEVATGTKAFDWEVPKEWNIKDAYVLDPKGGKIIDFKKSNLHVLGYSLPINKVVDLTELDSHLYSLVDQPNAIPYVTSYYKERWGFCIAHNERKKLKPGKYKVFIDSELKDGVLNYGEIIIPGKSKKEVFLSTYICHPSMANNELSGPVVTTYIVKWLMSKPRKYTYRIVFIPETIGSIVYLSRNLEYLKSNVIAGYNVTCVGDDRAYSYLPSRDENTISDKVALHVLNNLHPKFKKYEWADRGSDERQYCSPGVDLPIASIMRTKYGQYPEYHTSLDDLDLISAEGLWGAYDVLIKCIECLENNEKFKIKVFGEPQLGKRGLYPTISTKGSGQEVRNMMNLISYCDGKRDLIDIANKIEVPFWDLLSVVEKLKEHKLLEPVI
jgi:aminopeptidase-like protein